MDNEYTVWQLARMADCADPDSNESPGGRWLSLVASVIKDEPDIDPEDFGQEADNLVPVYTHERWQVFVDLGAWQEDISELGADASDLEACAGIALYMIAERLLLALWEEAKANDRQNWSDDQEGAE